MVLLVSILDIILKRGFLVAFQDLPKLPYLRSTTVMPVHGIY